MEQQQRRRSPRVQDASAARAARIRRISRRREAAGIYLNFVCIVLIVLFTIIGKARGVPFFKAPEGAQSVAQDSADTVDQSQEDAQAADTAETAEQPTSTEDTPRPNPGTYDITLSFMGDVNFDDDWATMQHLSSLSGGLSSVIDGDMLNLMNSADLFCVNNEFTFSTRGSQLEGKAYTFRSNPSNVSLYDTMGVDLVSLANNHIYDYGPEALTDTLTTLDGAGIGHLGAGENLSQAAKPYYTDIQNVRIGFVNACNAEVNRYTPEATASSSGVLLCYDHDKILAATREAEENADYVVAIVHWGRDYVYETSDAQRALARELIDAGADVIIGGHSHSLQGIEYYNGRPIFYSLGSCWFNGKTLETFLLEMHLVNDGKNVSITPVLVPAMQRDAELHVAANTNEAKQVTDLILNYSAGIWFESYPDEAHGGKTIAVLHQDEEAQDDWVPPAIIEVPNVDATVQNTPTAQTAAGTVTSDTTADSATADTATADSTTVDTASADAQSADTAEGTGEGNG